MIHIENINVTINAQALSDEAETSHSAACANKE